MCQQKIGLRISLCVQLELYKIILPPKIHQRFVFIMSDPMEYLTQDMSWNSNDGNFVLELHYNVIPEAIIDPLNQSMIYEVIERGMVATSQNTERALIIHCRCKQGCPTGDFEAKFCNSKICVVRWPGVTRIFVRIRVMESTTTDTLMDILTDDIEGGHSVSDVENPDVNQSFRPWSDQDDSETDTLNEDV